jgi:hypothetical protein
MQAMWKLPSNSLVNFVSASCISQTGGRIHHRNNAPFANLPKGAHRCSLSSIACTSSRLRTGQATVGE